MPWGEPEQLPSAHTLLRPHRGWTSEAQPRGTRCRCWQQEALGTELISEHPFRGSKISGRLKKHKQKNNTHKNPQTNKQTTVKTHLQSLQEN